MKPFKTLMKKMTIKAPARGKLYLDMRLKFMVVFLLMMLGLIASFGYLHIKSRSSIEKTLYPAVLNNLKQASGHLDLYLAQMQRVTQHIAEDCELQFLTQPGGYENGIYREDAALSLVGNMNAILEGVYILQGEKVYTLYREDNKRASIPDVTSNQWYKEVLANKAAATVIGTNQRFTTQGDCKNVFSFAQYMGASEILLVDYGYDALSQAASTYQGLPQEKNNPKALDQTQGFFYILDPHHAMMYSNDGNALSSIPEELVSNGDMVGQDRFQKITMEDTLYYVTASECPKSHWQVVSGIPAKTLFEVFDSNDRDYLLWGIVLIPVILLFYFFMTSLFLKPVSKLINALAEQQKDDYNVKIHFGESMEKSNVKETDLSIDRLTNKIYYTQMKQKEAQLNSLQNQINPHFLYNTLESIRGAALYHQAPVIASMAKCLSLFFRYSISDNILISLKEELKHLENYMAIQNFRHDDKFSIVYNIPEHLYEYKILKLSLQPLVENSIKHGLEMKLGKGTVKISIITLGDVLRIEVWDDGAGISPAKIHELNGVLAQSDYSLEKEPVENMSTGIGIKNVHSRMKLYFGTQYGIKFLPSTEGTTVELTLPIIKEASTPISLEQRRV